ncbi:MAG: asparagine synthase C-terminal domain-containing protein, partial [Butyrivibrio sp.]|nr:asparagine synthase C-terminal domain-containing protein [Butyrivibrio sp.]
NMKKIGKEIGTTDYPVLNFCMPSYVNALTLSETSEFIKSKGANVVFTGHGGDEGVSHRSDPYEMFYHHEYYRYLRYMWSLSHGKKGRIVKTIKACTKNLKESAERIKHSQNEIMSIEGYINKEFANAYSDKKIESSSFLYDSKNYILSGGSRNRLDNMAVLGAYSGVRYMVPYLDYRVVDYAVSIPRYLYLKGRFNRYIFRYAFKDIMPDSLKVLRSKRDVFLEDEDDENWFEDFDTERHKVIEMLDREMWKSYLDFAKIDEWLCEKDFDKEETFKQTYKTLAFMHLVIIQNVLKNS